METIVQKSMNVNYFCCKESSTFIGQKRKEQMTNMANET